ncbi:glycosyltransferase [Flavobacterium sp.]|uniref:glycosyltransferase n=1 Tax=Flavobacterium sp. TaxID=239 RepID=UPI00286A4998|nr:glycosyltransferase [Flavobacterium sp.]
MKLLYITSQIKGDGGLQRIMAIKTNYFIENFGYKIDILSPDLGEDLFFNFNKNISFHFIESKSRKLARLLEYKKQVQNHVDILKPDCIIVSDFGLKGFTIPLIIKTKIPVVFEVHGSKYNESAYYKKTFFSTIFHNLKYTYKDFCANKFDFFVALSDESLKEWSVNDGFVIPNCLETTNHASSNLNLKKAIVVARHSYEKGIDRVLKIWKLVTDKHPDWQLEIYGGKNQELGLEQLVKELDIASNVTFYIPVKNIQQKYQEAAMYLMTSRFEGFGMVILEAMSSGLPVIAFDCPIGPRSIIEDNKDGFLIEDGNLISFAEKVNQLIQNQDLRIQIAKSGRETIARYDLDKVMILWKNFFDKVNK